MIVERLVVGMFQENAFVVVCEETREAVLVDPGDEAERIAALVAKLDAKPVRIVNTHAHIDHVGAVEDLRRKYGIPFGLHEREVPVLDMLQDSARLFGLDAPPQPEVDFFVAGSDEVPCGAGTLTVLETPGHTPGGISLHGEGFVLAGDTLFKGSIGRTDLPGGDFATLRESIRGRLFALPPETVVHCGHGPDTRIRVEKASNPFVGDGANPSFYGLT